MTLRKGGRNGCDGTSTGLARQGPRHLRLRRQPAHGGIRSHQCVRLHPARRDPPQGRDPHAHLRVLVRALCRPHPQPHDLLRRGRPPRGVRALRRLPRRPLHARQEGADRAHRVHRPRLPDRLRQEDLRPGRHRLRHQAARGSDRGLQAPRADLHPVHQGGARRPRREHLLRALLRDRGHRGRRAAARRLARHLQGRGGLRRDARHHHRRHQVRVRLHRRQAHPHRRVPHARLQPLLAGRGLRGGQGPAELRQAVRPRLAARQLGHDRRAAAHPTGSAFVPARTK